MSFASKIRKKRVRIIPFATPWVSKSKMGSFIPVLLLSQLNSSVRHRIEVFLERIAPLYPDLTAHGPKRHNALKRLQRICEREVNRLRSKHTLATVKFYLSSYRNALRAIDPNHPVLSARRHRSHQRFSYLALTPEETRAINAAYQKEIHKDQSDLIPLDPQAFIATATDLLNPHPDRFPPLGPPLR